MRCPSGLSDDVCTTWPRHQGSQLHAIFQCFAVHNGVARYRIDESVNPHTVTASSSLRLILRASIEPTGSIERADRNVSIDSMERLAGALNVDIEDLLEVS